MPPRLLASSLCCHAAFISVSTPDSRANPVLRAACLEWQFGRSRKHDVGHIGSNIFGAGAIAFETWHRRFGSAINHLRFTLSHFLRFGVDLREMRTFAYTRLGSDSGPSKGGQRTLTQRFSSQSACFIRKESKRACLLPRFALWNV